MRIVGTTLLEGILVTDVQEGAIGEDQPQDAEQESTLQSEVSLKQRFLRPQTLVSFVIAFVILYFLWANIDINVEETVEVLRGTDVFLLFLSFAMYYLTFPLRGWRWWLLLGNAGSEDLPSIKDMTEISFLGYFANSVVPAKLGDVYRSYLIKKDAGISFPKVLGTVFSERLIALIVLAVMVAITSLIGFRGHLPAAVQQTLGMTLILVVIGVVGLMVLRGGRELIRKVIPGRFRPLYLRFEEGLFLSLKRFPLLLALTILIWAMEGGRFFFAARAVDLPVDPMTSLFIALASALLTVLPFTPSGLGIVESGIVVVLLLASEMGLLPEVGRSEALSAALLDRLVAYWSLLFLGMVVYLFSRKTK